MREEVKERIMKYGFWWGSILLSLLIFIFTFRNFADGTWNGIGNAWFVYTFYRWGMPFLALMALSIYAMNKSMYCLIPSAIVMMLKFSYYAIAKQDGEDAFRELPGNISYDILTWAVFLFPIVVRLCKQNRMAQVAYLSMAYVWAIGILLFPITWKEKVPVTTNPIPIAILYLCMWFLTIYYFLRQQKVIEKNDMNIEAIPGIEKFRIVLLLCTFTVIVIGYGFIVRFHDYDYATRTLQLPADAIFFIMISVCCLILKEKESYILSSAGIVGIGSIFFYGRDLWGDTVDVWWHPTFTSMAIWFLVSLLMLFCLKQQKTVGVLFLLFFICKKAIDECKYPWSWVMHDEGRLLADFLVKVNITVIFFLIALTVVIYMRQEKKKEGTV